MSKSKTKLPIVNLAPAKSHGHSDALSTRQQEFSDIVNSIAKRFDIKIASVPMPIPNPYAMSPEQANQIAVQAGIITRAGNLTRRFR